MPELEMEGVVGMSVSSSPESAKFLVDGNGSTCWQSSGRNPHHILVEFKRNYVIKKLNISFGLPGLWSYQPNTIQVYVGNSLNSLEKVNSIESIDCRGGSSGRILDLLGCQMDYHKYVKVLLTAHGCDCQVISLEAQGVFKDQVSKPFRLSKIEPVRQTDQRCLANEKHKNAIKQRMLDVMFEGDVMNDNCAQLSDLIPKELMVPERLDSALEVVQEKFAFTDWGAMIQGAQQKLGKTEYLKLSTTMRGVLCLFTDDPDRDKSVYLLLNNFLHRGDAEGIQPWHVLFSAILRSIQALPPEHGNIFYCGCAEDITNLKVSYEVGNQFTWRGFRTVTNNFHTLNQLIPSSGARTIFSLQLTHPIARDLSPFSEFRCDSIQPPILFLPPGMAFLVESVFQTGNTTLVRCKQTESDFCLDMSFAPAVISPHIERAGEGEDEPLINPMSTLRNQSDDFEVAIPTCVCGENLVKISSPDTSPAICRHCHVYLLGDCWTCGECEIERVYVCSNCALLRQSERPDESDSEESSQNTSLSSSYYVDETEFSSVSSDSSSSSDEDDDDSD
eukprot:m.121196 g.121196  ORF g.121196 m.121196 type:complete len:560 (+) comp14384_c0_seq3:207-1886(+)